MQTITLKVEDTISDKFLWFIEHFSKNEVEILEHNTYISDDEYLKSIKGMQESIIKEANTPLNEYVTRDELDW